MLPRVTLFCPCILTTNLLGFAIGDEYRSTSPLGLSLEKGSFSRNAICSLWHHETALTLDAGRIRSVVALRRRLVHESLHNPTLTPHTHPLNVQHATCETRPFTTCNSLTHNRLHRTTFLQKFASHFTFSVAIALTTSLYSTSSSLSSSSVT